MTTGRPRLAIDESYISELLEVAASILKRHADRGLAEKAAAMERCWELTKQYPEGPLGDSLQRAIFDLNEAVVLHLNIEINAVATLFRQLAAQ